MKKISVSFYGASVTQQAINQSGEMVGYVPHTKKIVEEKHPEYEFVFHQLGFGSNHLDDAGYLYFSRLLDTSPDIVFLEWHTTGLAKFDSAKYDYIIEKLLNMNCVAVNLILPFKRCISKPERENIKQSRWYQEKGVRQINFYKLLDGQEIEKCLRDEVHTNQYGGLVYGKIISKVIEDILQGKQIEKDSGDVIAPIEIPLKAPKVSSFNLQRDLEQDETMLVIYNPTANQVRFFCESTVGPFSPILDVRYQNKTETIMLIDQWCSYERKCLKPISPAIGDDVSSISFSISRNNPLEREDLQHLADKNPTDLRKIKNIEKIYCQGGEILNIEITKRKIKVFVFANCHGAIYKQALQEADKEKILDIEHVISYENMNNFENIKPKFAECDILIIQPVQNYEQFKIENIKLLLKKECQLIRVPFVRFNGYWDRNDIRQLKKFTSPAVMFFPNLYHEDEVKDYLRGNIEDKNEILANFDKGVQEMIALEEQGDVKFVDFFLKNHQSIPFFRDSYHPTKVMYNYISHQIVKLIRQNISTLNIMQFILPDKLEKEFGHFKPIKDSVANVLKIKYNLDTYWKYKRKVYLEAILKYENSSNEKIIEELKLLDPILNEYQNTDEGKEIDTAKKYTPYFTIVTVTYEDVWNLSKTIQSVMSQDENLFEYIVIDGNSSDETDDLIDFWKNGLKKKFTYIKEKDSGVYDAMNKGIDRARGQYICFMNAGDKFKSSNTLNIVKSKIDLDNGVTALLGWGELGREIYAPWVESFDAYAMSSLGFCHQSLYVRSDIAKNIKFDSRKGQTDSDTLHIASIIKKYGPITILDEILAVRSDDPGISANMENTKKSIIKTISEYFDDIDLSEAEIILNFRRKLENVNELSTFFINKSENTVLSISIMILDSLILRPKKNQKLNDEYRELLFHAIEFLQQYEHGTEVLVSMELVLDKMKLYYEKLNNRQLLTLHKTKQIEEKEKQRIAKVKTKKKTDVIVTLTSFPGRFKSLHLVLDSLFNQTIKPKKVILYLALSEVKNINWVPGNIKKFINQGLEIVALEQNYFQYNKFYFAKEVNQYSPIITVDDDVLYPSIMIEKLLEFHKKYPQCVIANRAHEITYNKDNVMDPYVKWKKEAVEDVPSHELVATGVGGVLYPVGFIDDFCSNTNSIIKSAPHADDIWLKIVALKNNITVMTTDLEKIVRWYCGYTPETSENALQEINVATGLNDKQFHRGLNDVFGYKGGKLKHFLEKNNDNK